MSGSEAIGDGAEFHGPDRAQADAARRDWLDESGGWMFGIYVADDVQGTGQRASDRLRHELAEARRTYAARRRVVI